jgi:hypothetical protein
MSAWQGIQSDTPVNRLTWPNAVKPSLNAWNTWRTFLAQGITAGQRLLSRCLGAWLYDDPMWPWYYNPIDEQLYEKCG